MGPRSGLRASATRTFERGTPAGPRSEVVGTSPASPGREKTEPGIHPGQPVIRPRYIPFVRPRAARFHARHRCFVGLEQPARRRPAGGTSSRVWRRQPGRRHIHRHAEEPVGPHPDGLYALVRRRLRGRGSFPQFPAAVHRRCLRIYSGRPVASTGHGGLVSPLSRPPGFCDFHARLRVQHRQRAGPAAGRRPAHGAGLQDRPLHIRGPGSSAGRVRLVVTEGPRSRGRAIRKKDAGAPSGPPPRRC